MVRLHLVLRFLMLNLPGSIFFLPSSLLPPFFEHVLVSLLSQFSSQDEFRGGFSHVGDGFVGFSLSMLISIFLLEHEM